MTRVSHVWGQVGSMTSAEGGPVLGSLCWGRRHPRTRCAHVLGPAGGMAIGDWIQAQRTVKDAAAKAVLLRLEEAADRVTGWPRLPRGPRGGLHGTDHPWAWGMKPPSTRQRTVSDAPIHQLTCHPIILTPSKEGVDSGQQPGTA